MSSVILDRIAVALERIVDLLADDYASKWPEVSAGALQPGDRIYDERLNEIRVIESIRNAGGYYAIGFVDGGSSSHDAYVRYRREPAHS